MHLVVIMIMYIGKNSNRKVKTSQYLEQSLAVAELKLSALMPIT